MQKSFFALFFCIFFLTSSLESAADTNFSYTSKLEFPLASNVVAIDVRSEKLCLKGTLSGARCLQYSDFFGPHGRLINFPDLLWLLGSSGLSGDEHLLVFGVSPEKRDFVAGLLFLAGQKKVTILKLPFRELQKKVSHLVLGQKRSNIRTAVYLKTFRDELIILRNELVSVLKNENLPELLDGRSEKEYWGENIRTFRGGHIPHAQHLPADKLRTLLNNDSDNVILFSSPIVYAHNTSESIAYFSLLRAGFRVNARVFIEGWVDWAMHPSLAVDSQTYLDKQSTNNKKNTEKDNFNKDNWLYPLAITLVGFVLIGWGVYSKYKKRT